MAFISDYRDAYFTSEQLDEAFSSGSLRAPASGNSSLSFHFQDSSFSYVQYDRQSSYRA
jgi:hypothetical protein